MAWHKKCVEKLNKIKLECYNFRNFKIFSIIFPDPLLKGIIHFCWANVVQSVYTSLFSICLYIVVISNLSVCRFRDCIEFIRHSLQPMIRLVGQFISDGNEWLNCLFSNHVVHKLDNYLKLIYIHTWSASTMKCFQELLRYLELISSWDSWVWTIIIAAYSMHE